MFTADDIKYIGVQDKITDLFESQYPLPDGVTYNSYVILDQKVAVLDTVDEKFCGEWLQSLQRALGQRQPDYLIIHHMEPDHSAGIKAFADKYPQAKIAASARAFAIMKGFFGTDFADRQLKLSEGDVLQLGGHSLRFIAAPMVHWPEVMMSYDEQTGTLFSADAFGRFGVPTANCDPIDEARRYYIGIVGKYGAQVQAVLKKASELPLTGICPLHGPMLVGEGMRKMLGLYDTWSSYRPEQQGVTVAYASIYGHTGAAAQKLAEMLAAHGVRTQIFDLARCDMYQAVASAFRFDKLALASSTYNGDVLPAMRAYIQALTDRGFRDRTAAFIENGCWAPTSARVMRQMLQDCKDIRFAEPAVKLMSALDDGSTEQLRQLAEQLK